MKTIQPEAVIDLIVGLPKILVFKSAQAGQMDGDEKGGVAAYTVITDKELSVVGKKPGRTVLNLWFTDPKDITKEFVFSYLVHVFADPETQIRRRTNWKNTTVIWKKKSTPPFPTAWCVCGLSAASCSWEDRPATSSRRHKYCAWTPRGINQSGTTTSLSAVVDHGLAQSKIQKLPNDVGENTSGDKDADGGTNPYFRGGCQSSTCCTSR